MEPPLIFVAFSAPESSVVIAMLFLAIFFASQIGKWKSGSSLSEAKTEPVSAIISSLPSKYASVKKFVFFEGYGRSGHSIIGSLMDAHPHVIIPYQF